MGKSSASATIRNLTTASILAISLCAASNAAAQDAGEIVVTGQRAQQAQAIESKRNALGIVDVVSADEIGRLPDRNVAEMIERLPGVGVQYDQGEGRYVSVRGVPSDLNGYTLNGFEIGNPDGDSRKLPMDILSGQLLNRIDVHKVKTADLVGQGIGGTINLVPQTAFDFDRPFILAADAQVGYQDLDDSSTPFEGSASVGGTFGQNDAFGILLGVSYSDRTYTSNGIYPDGWFAIGGVRRGGSPTNIKYTDYELKRQRLGVSGSLDWRGDTTELYLRGTYSKFTEDEYRQRFRLDFASPEALESGDMVFNADGVTGTSIATEQRSDLRLEYKEKSILSFMAGGRTTLDAWVLDYGVARTHNEVIEPNQGWQFRGNPGAVAFDFTDKLYTAVPVDGFLSPADLEFRSMDIQDQVGEEDIWQARFDVTRDMQWGTGGFIKAGVNFRSTDKGFDDQSQAYGRGASGNRFSLDGLAGRDVTVFPESGRGYLVAPTIDPALMQAFADANLGSSLIVLDEAGTLANQVLGDFQIDEEVLSGYAMANLEFGALAVTAGLRVERTSLDGSGYRLENETDIVPASDKGSYTDWLPSIVVRYAPAEDVVLRAAWSRSVGRPNYADLKPGGELSYELVSDDLYAGGLSLGNAALKPYRADNLDVSAEWYFAPGGMLAVAGFAKWIDDPIFTRSYIQTDVNFGGRQFATLTFSQPENATSGDIFGLELAWQQQFTFLPGLLSGLGVNANLTLVESSLEVPGRVKSDFPEQSNLLFGAQLFYQKGPVEASLGYNRTGRALIGIANDPIEDQSNDDISRVDAKIAVDISDRFRVFAQGQNLTDEKTRQYQGDHRNWVLQQERYGRTFWLGASFRY